MKLVIDIHEGDYRYIKGLQSLTIARGTCKTIQRDVINAIKNGTPYEERPKGKWIRTGSLGNGNAHYTCSNCSYGDEHAESQEVPYCWHCGADMRGDV